MNHESPPWIPYPMLPGLPANLPPSTNHQPRPAAIISATAVQSIKLPSFAQLCESLKRPETQYSHSLPSSQARSTYTYQTSRASITNFPFVIQSPTRQRVFLWESHGYESTKVGSGEPKALTRTSSQRNRTIPHAPGPQEIVGTPTKPSKEGFINYPPILTTIDNRYKKDAERFISYSPQSKTGWEWKCIFPLENGSLCGKRFSQAPLVRRHILNNHMSLRLEEADG
ncbi:hypothetical protein JR316_0011615 [Psilocybe cubensis]|uniref:Uncharacterized protein n=2 Tax=Psilocybe cubensis TaxID=181762 RepID=A0ACB8GK38_PSICU|nr:hypothetical protein JR316_0011615 [Psilocybe cubensis]KAH9476046.1 hypothetical protein JR316_0011615 [Psilocybe cubensis]